MQMARQLAMLRTVMSAIPPMSHTLIAGHEQVADTAGASDTTAARLWSARPFSGLVGLAIALVALAVLALWLIRAWRETSSWGKSRSAALRPTKQGRYAEGPAAHAIARTEATTKSPHFELCQCWPLATPGLATSTENEPWPAVSRISVKLPRSSRFIFGSNAILGRSGEARAMLGRHGGAVQYP